ncbi:MAG: GNAT family N-acetyltransferase [Chitinophagaceae bacterium]|nr:MAG: GNAT family N-acetyltransferase [Chitinophagaceae bacterium]
MIYITVPLDVSHDRISFTCGKLLLDLYLQKQARQDVKRKLSACFILPSQNQIKAYYTLSAASVERQVLPDEIIKKLPPSYIDLPAVLLGRLAVSNSYHRQGLGEAMLIDALKRSYYASSQVGSMAVLVDPLDEEAKQFYEKYNFINLPDTGKMFLPMATIAQLF